MRALLDGVARSGRGQEPRRSLQTLRSGGRRVSPQRFGSLVAAASLTADQLSQNLLLYEFGCINYDPSKRVGVLPFFDIVMVWNRGVSYGLLQADGLMGTLLLSAFSFVAVAALGWW